ncbi:YjgN family protein [Sphingomicrobium sediminis]|uniref:YjgN family protein n=1 Tax=Sphingomicrobium sediminis TaxID=2950949 RepID=A0A9X2J2L4_9SPHN|nr:YjgN family protein [Sphingomicrobium sediminis]MCM8557904.1 YjgN family protein [Sphingomicrobium sediminis]
MNIHHQETAHDPGLPVEFRGDWKEYAGIAIPNFLLTIVTLGIYRFWAIARERRYLWSRTHAAGDPLEWTGTGKEMFIGFVLVALIVLLPFYLVVQWVVPALVARGQDLAAGLLTLLVYLGIGALGGTAMFRALRYRLSRTWWRGIRGGSDEPGFAYGGQTLGYGILSAISLGLAYPWTQAQLWNSRWNEMEFGSMRFDARLEAGELYPRWLLLYLVPFVGIIAFIAGGAAIFSSAAQSSVDAAGGGFVGFIVAILVVFYILMPLLFLAYHAKYLRAAVEATTIGEVQPHFRARTLQWIWLWVGNIALAVVTLGIGALFWSYRNWKFVVSHLELEGRIDPDQLAQSQTEAPGDAEGLADAFDIGAF